LIYTHFRKTSVCALLPQSLQKCSNQISPLHNHISLPQLALTIGERHYLLGINVIACSTSKEKSIQLWNVITWCGLVVNHAPAFQSFQQHQLLPLTPIWGGKYMEKWKEKGKKLEIWWVLTGNMFILMWCSVWMFFFNVLAMLCL